MNMLFRTLSVCLAALALSTLAYAQKQPEFERGYYYRFDSTKVTGEISYNFGRDRWFFFRTDLDAPPQLVMARDSYEFSIRGRRFVMKENTKSQYKIWNEHGQSDFVEIVIDDQISLFKDYYSDPVARGQHQLSTDKNFNYLVQRKGEQGILRISKTKKRFIKEMTAFFKDYEKLSKLISDEELTYDDLEYIVNLYNIWYSDNVK